MQVAGEHSCGSVITHYDTFILRLQSAVGSPRGNGDAAPAGALAVADDTLYHRLRHGHHRLSTSCATPLPPTARERLTPWLTISRSADRPMGTGDAGDRDGRDACDGILQSTIFTVAIVATVALSLFERRYVCLCQGYAPPSVLGSILITHPIFVQKSATFHVQILGQCIRRKL